jgi:hypothetical protein
MRKLTTRRIPVANAANIDPFRDGDHEAQQVHDVLLTSCISLFGEKPQPEGTMIAFEPTEVSIGSNDPGQTRDVVRVSLALPKGVTGNMVAKTLLGAANVEASMLVGILRSVARGYRTLSGEREIVDACLAGISCCLAMAKGQNPAE